MGGDVGVEAGAALQAVHARREGGGVAGRLGQCGLDQRDLEGQAGVPAAHLHLGLGEQVHRAQEFDAPQAPRLRGQALQPLRRGVDQPGVGRGGQQEQRAQVLDRVARELAQVDALVGEPLDQHAQPGDVAPGDPVGRLHQQLVGDGAQDLGAPAQGDGAALVRRDLVQDAERVARAAVARPDDEVDGAGLEGEALAPSQVLDVRGQHVPGDPAEVEPLGPRQDRRQDLVRLGGGEDEHDVAGRLLDGLEERVPARGRQHVALVDDVDLRARRGRRERDPLAQVAGVVDAAVAGGVDLDDVD